METKTVDIRGRLYLGKEYAGKTFLFQQVSDTRIILDLAEVIPTEEYRRAKALLEKAEEQDETEPKASSFSDPAEGEQKDEQIPAVQEASPPGQRKKAKKETDQAPIPVSMTPETQMAIAGAVKVFFGHLKLSRGEDAVVSALRMAEIEAFNTYVGEMKLDWNTVPKARIFKAWRDQGLWPEKRTKVKEKRAFFKNLKAMLEAQGVVVSRQ